MPSENSQIPSVRPLVNLALGFIVAGVALDAAAASIWVGIANGDWGIAWGCLIIGMGTIGVGLYFLRAALKLRKKWKAD